MTPEDAARTAMDQVAASTGRLGPQHQQVVAGEAPALQSHGGRDAPTHHPLTLAAREFLADGFDHLLLIGKAAGLQFRPDQLVAGRKLEAASPEGYQLQTFNLLFELSQQPAGQAHGLRLVVSHRAVLERQFHGGYLRFLVVEVFFLALLVFALATLAA